MVLIVTTVSELRRQIGQLLREQPGAVGLVPTMGALHAGHLSLLRRCRSECSVTVVSIFVNPKQFGEQADLDNYPRTLEADSALCAAEDVDIIFAPSPAEVYPAGFSTSVHVGALTDRWEGEFRPGHFDGVATVVAKLFMMVMPERAYFGEKDFQQLAVVRRMAQDLNLPVEVIGCPTVREGAGLALSSRNVRLSPEDVQAARRISLALQRVQSFVLCGETESATLIEDARRHMLGTDGLLSIEYLAVVDPRDFRERRGPVQAGDRVITAVRCGAVRLIDNMELQPATAGAAGEQIQAGQATGTGP